MVYTRGASSEVDGCYSTGFAQFVRTCLAILGYGIQYEQGLRALGRLGFCSSFKVEGCAQFLESKETETYNERKRKNK